MWDSDMKKKNEVCVCVFNRAFLRPGVMMQVYSLLFGLVRHNTVVALSVSPSLSAWSPEISGC